VELHKGTKPAMKILSILFPMGYFLRNGYWLIFLLSQVVLFLALSKLHRNTLGHFEKNYIIPDS